MRQGPGRIDIGRVDEIHARVCGGVKDAERFCFAGLVSESPGPEAET
jgi:hypothetical protein